MNQSHEISDKEVIPAILICFTVAGVLGFSGSYIYQSQIIFKSVDALFITGCILVAMKLARKGWDLSASGYTLLSIAWGVFFLAKDFNQQGFGADIFASAFYFMFPSMVLISFYKPFPFIIKLLTLLSIIPSLFMLISVKASILPALQGPIKDIGYQMVHVVSIVWGAFFFWQHKSRNKA